MKGYVRILVAAVALLACSGAVYCVHDLVFDDAHHIFIFMLGDIAFVPIEVLLVVIIIERMLARHEKQQVLQKLNMVIGVFFTELGTRLLGDLTRCVTNGEDLQSHLAVDATWSARDYKNSLTFAHSFDYVVTPGSLNLNALRDTLQSKRDLLVNLLASPSLQEHERFTDLLWAVAHLMEELAARDSLEGLPQTDLDHIGNDVRRVYSLLTVEWLFYCQHLQTAYPYIFSIVVRTHPLQETPCAVVT
jgi:hypothetical protein